MYKFREREKKTTKKKTRGTYEDRVFFKYF